MYDENKKLSTKSFMYSNKFWSYHEKMYNDYAIKTTNKKYVLGSRSQEIDCKLWAEVCEWPIEDSWAMENLRFESFIYDFSQAVGRSLPILRMDFGRFWNVSLK